MRYEDANTGTQLPATEWSPEGQREKWARFHEARARAWEEEMRQAVPAIAVQRGVVLTEPTLEEALAFQYRVSVKDGRNLRHTFTALVDCDDAMLLAAYGEYRDAFFLAVVPERLQLLYRHMTGARLVLASRGFVIRMSLDRAVQRVQYTLELRLERAS